MAKVTNSISLGGSGGSSIIVVANYSALPDPTTVSGLFYWVSNSQGTKWLPGSLGGTYYNSGLYYSNGTTWEFMNVPYQATQLEVDTGTNTDKFVTPSTLSNSTWAFTTAKTLATLLTGISFATGGAIVSTDTVLIAFGKIQKQINDLNASLSSYVQTSRTINSKPLTSDIVLTAADIGYNQVILTSSTTAQASWNGKVVKVRGNLTITIPASGLPTGYTFEFMVDPTFTLTWAIVTKTWVFGTPTTNAAKSIGTILQDEQDDSKIYLLT